MKLAGAQVISSTFSVFSRVGSQFVCSKEINFDNFVYFLLCFAQNYLEIFTLLHTN